ncbi:MAG TPA: iron uptake porin, partial [Allocoleopsis sp.]
MRYVRLLVYMGLLLAGVLTAPVAAQAIDSEHTLNLDRDSSETTTSQIANPQNVTREAETTLDGQPPSAIERSLSPVSETTNPVASAVTPQLHIANSTQTSTSLQQNASAASSILAQALGSANSNKLVYPSLGNPGDDQVDPMAELTNVSQLRDVQPSDWAFEALRSLVERYACIAGYPDGTFRGNRAISRYEFAAGLSACLQQIERFITNPTGSVPTQNDLQLLQRLLDEFRPELATLKTGVDALERGTTFLEEHQFSPTTKLFGQAVIGIQGRSQNTADFFPVDGIQDTDDPATNINVITNVQLSFFTQLGPRSILLAGLQAGEGNTGNPVLTNDVRLGYEGDTNNKLVVSDLNFRQLIGNNFALIVGPVGVNAVNVFRGDNRVESAGFGPLSRFALRNPVVSIGAGRGGLGFDWQISPRISLQGVYSASLPENADFGGIFGGDLGETSVGAQLTLTPIRSVNIALDYLNAYSPFGRLGTGVGDDQLTVNSPLQTDAFGATVSWRVTPRFTIGAWGGYTNSRIPDESGNVETINWMAFL